MSSSYHLISYNLTDSCTYSILCFDVSSFDEEHLHDIYVTFMSSLVKRRPEILINKYKYMKSNMLWDIIVNWTVCLITQHDILILSHITWNYTMNQAQSNHGIEWYNIRIYHHLKLYTLWWSRVQENRLNNSSSDWDSSHKRDWHTYRR